MRLNLTIATKLVIAYVLFLAPIGFLTYEMISGKQASIAFAQKELAGVRYIAEIRSVQDAVVRGSDMAALVERIRANQQERGADLKTSEPAEALIKALGGSDRPAATQAAADLIGKAADGSNLTLDPDLDSFYTQDALTVKIPTAVAGISALVEAVSGTAGRDVSVADQVTIGVQVGSLQPTLDGLASDIQSAAEGNPDKSVAPALTAPVAKVSATAKEALSALADHALAGRRRRSSCP